MYFNLIVYAMVLLESKTFGGVMPFKRVFFLDDVLFTDNVLFERHHVRSRLYCATACVQTPGCLTFIFHPSGLCQGHNAAFTDFTGRKTSVGARTYQTGYWLERPCVTDSDCQTNVLYVKCFQQRCLCKPGYFYSISSKTCITSCQSEDRQNTFLEYPGWRVLNNNILENANVTLDWCKLECVKNHPTCSTIEFSSNFDCNIASVTPLQNPSAWQHYLEYDYNSQGKYDYLQRMCS